jgi:hypothetical protein
MIKTHTRLLLARPNHEQHRCLHRHTRSTALDSSFTHHTPHLVPQEGRSSSTGNGRRGSTTFDGHRPDTIWPVGLAGIYSRDSEAFYGAVEVSTIDNVHLRAVEIRFTACLKEPCTDFGSHERLQTTRLPSMSDSVRSQQGVSLLLTCMLCVFRSSAKK